MLQITSVKYMINPRAAAALSLSMRDEGRLHMFIDKLQVIDEEVVLAPPSKSTLSPRFTRSPRGVQIPR